MPNPISSEQLLQYRKALDSGQMTAVQFYQNMLIQGYMYAGWAGGVAAGDEFAGIAALEYLKKSAADGAGGRPSKVVTDIDIANIRRDMAYAYLTAMETIAADSNGTTNRDVNFAETEKFHKDVFEKNGFSIDNWTLKIPMDLIKKTGSEADVENIWTQVRDTGGTGISTYLQNTFLMHRVGRLINSKDQEVVDQAVEWMERVPGTLDFPALWKITTTFGELGLQFLKNRVDEIVKLANYGIDLVSGNDPPKQYINGDWKTTKYSNGAQISESMNGAPDGINVKWITPRSDGGTDEGQNNWITGEQTIYHWSGKSNGSVDLLSKTVIGPVSSNTYNEVTTSTDKASGSYIENIKVKSFSDKSLLEERNTVTAKDGSSVVTIETDTNISKAKYDENNSKIEGSWLHKNTGEHGGYQRDLETGTETTIVLDKNNVVTNRVVERKNGTTETATYNPETGSRTETTVSADKSKVENFTDAYGSRFYKRFDKNGKLFESSSTLWDGTEVSETISLNDDAILRKSKDRDGNVTYFSDDKMGNVREIVVDKDGVQKSEKWKKSDGSHSESKIVEGVKTTVFKDGNGAEQTTIFGTDGSSRTNWKKPDGSKGTVVEGADGTLSGTTILVDGSKQIFSKGTDGVTNTDYITSWGQRVAHTWTGPDGSYGKETFDGRKYTSITVNADKSTQIVSDDGKGNIAIIKRDSSNNTTSLWSQADGTVTFEKTDAKQVSTGIVYGKDGGHVRYVNDKLNASNSSVTYDKQGNFSSSSYKKTDGTSGGVYISDGKREDGSIDERSKGNIIEFSLGGPGSNEKQNVTTYQKNGVITNSTVYTNGTHKNYSDDGNGTRTETVFGEGGVGIVSNTTIRYNADGSGIATTTTVNGTTEKTFGPGGITILSKPDTRPDISPPVEKVEADLPSVWDPSVGSGNTADNLPKDKQENGGPNIPAEVKPDDGESEITQEPYTGDPNVTVPHIESRIINDDTNEQYNNAIKWQPRRDPLTIDLNGNGLDTTGASLTNPILFDHDGDGIKTGTGWILPDDGFLTLDRNDNGKIDTGAELFGDSTPLYGGGKAQDGFAALADQDSNRDGKVDKLDTNWDKLRVWRDLNQDGESQKNELFTLNEIGINSFNVAKTANSVFLANGNQIADLGSYTRVDGTRGTVGETGQIADVNLAEDTFNSKFTDHIPLVAGVALLPEMQGSGQVRSLREAASIDSAAGRALKAKLTEFAKAKTHAAQRALLEDLIVAWGATSNMVTSIKASHETGTGTLTAVEQFAKDQPGVFKRIDALERFNGSNFLVRRIVAGANSTHSVNIESDRLAVLDLSWTNLSESVYSNLLLQTRFRSLLSQLDLKVDNANIRVNGAKAKAYFEQATSSRSIDGLADLIEFNKYVAPLLTSSDWDGRILMAQLIQSMPLTAELRALYAEQRIVIDPSKPGYMVGTALDDILVAVANSQNMTGNEGNDMLFGGGSNDALDGGAGNDFLSGGAGDDVLIGGTGNDVYLWGKGSGNDQLINNDTSSGRTDVIQITADTKPEEVIVRNDGQSLTLKIKGTNDTLLVSLGFSKTGVNAMYMVDEIRFADGTVWNARKIEEESLRPTDEDDILNGFDRNETISGSVGNDYISGWGGNDVLNGDDGSDRLYGGDGDDTIDGGSGGDIYAGGEGDDTYIWGKGSGSDAIVDIYSRDYGGSGAQGNDTIKIKSGTKPSDIRVARSWGIYGAGNDLTLVIPGDSDLRLEHILSIHNPSVNKIVFDDDTVWDLAKLKELSILGDETSQKIAGFNDANDTILGKAGNDTIYGAGGADTLYGDAGDDQLYGENGDDTLIGGEGFDILIGGDGDDFLDSGIGGADLTGGKGNDTYVWGQGYGHVSIDNTTNKKEPEEKPGFDRLLIKALPSDIVVRFQYGVGFYIYLKNAPADGNGARPESLYISAQIANGHTVDTTLDEIIFSDGTVWNSAKLKQMVLEGTEFDDDIDGYLTDDLIHGNDGVDNIVADKGNDTIFGGNGVDYIHGGEGNDIVYGDEGDDHVRGNEGNDTLYGGDGDDTLIGDEGDDVLDGGAGNDNLGGTQGHDTILWGRGSGRDTAFAVDPSQSADNTINLIFKSGLKPSDISFSRDKRDLIIRIKDGNDELRIREFFVSGNRFDGMRFADDKNFVWTQQQILDMQSLNHAPRINAHLATIEAKETLALNYSVVENAFVDDDIGDSLTYTATINKGAPLPDWLKFDPATKVFSGIPPDMSAGLYSVQLTATDSFGASTTIDFSLSIDSLAPRATEGNDKLVGTAVNDLITGLGGDDTIDGGLGADTLIGGVGNDVYIVDNVQDIVVEIHGNDTDQINSSVTYTLSENVEGLLLTGSNAINGTGNALSNAIWGNDADNILDGGDGDDLLVGGKGNDTLYGNEADRLQGGEGDDTYIISAYKNRSVNIEIKDTAGNTQIQLGDGFTKDTLTLGDPGNKSDILLQSGTNTIRIIYGKILGVDNISRITFANGDYLDKAGIADLMTGGSLDGTNGNDNLKAPDAGAHIHGYSGNDVITGGSGTDIFWGDDGEDTLIGAAGDDKLYGGDYDDRLIGGEGNNVLSGEGDNDTLIDGSGSSILLGGYGDDTYEGGAGDDQLFDQYGSDTYIFNLGDGKDTIADGTYEEHTSSSSDRICFGQGISAKDVHLSLAANGTDLIVKYSDHDQITILGGANGAIETYVFADGTVVSHEAFLRGTGTGGTLSGGTGKDVYQINSASGELIIDDLGGNNLIKFADDIQLASIKASQVKNADGSVSLLLKIGTGGDQVLIKNGLSHANMTYQFANDTLFSHGQFLNLVLTDSVNLTGAGSSKNLIGGKAGDVLQGGSANEVLTGGQGLDTYIFGRGAGQDIAIETNGESSLIALKPGVNVSDLALQRMGDNLFIGINGTSDSLVLRDYFKANSQWAVKADQGSSVSLSSLLGAINSATQATSSAEKIEKYRQDFLNAHNHYFSELATERSNSVSTYIENGVNVTSTTTTSAPVVSVIRTTSDSAEIHAQDPVVQDNISVISDTQVSKAVTSESIVTTPVTHAPVFVRRIELDELVKNRYGRYDAPANSVAVYVDKVDPANGSTTKELAYYNLYQNIQTTYVEQRVVQTNNVTLRTIENHQNQVFSVEDIRAGSSDNHILYGAAATSLWQNGTGYQIIDAGAGNDFVDSGMGIFASSEEAVNWKLFDTYKDVQMSSLNRSMVESVVYSNDHGASGSFIHGGAGNDTLLGSAGRDEIIGGEGDDIMNGGAMGDWYRLLAADNGWDTIYDSGVVTSTQYGFSIENYFQVDIDQSTLPKDSVIFEAGIKLSDLTFSWGSFEADTPHQTLNISWGEGKGVRIVLANEQDAAGFGVEIFEFADGSKFSLEQMMMHAPGRPIMGANNTPVAVGSITLQTVVERKDFSFTLPDGLFNDVDAGDTLTYSLSLANGDALPVWLKFDQVTGKLSGTPGHADIGEIAIRVTAKDRGQLTSSLDFSLSVTEAVAVNTAPELKASLADLALAEKKAFTLVIPDTLFVDTDMGDALTYSATLADGKALPSWLTFDAATKTLSGTPDHAAVGDLLLSISVKDKGGLTAKTNLNLHVADYVAPNTAPVAVKALADQSLTEKAAFSLALPAGTFTDADAGDVLAYSATLANGSPLPSWLTFDAITKTLSGTPDHAAVGDLSLSIVAKDKGGLTAKTNLNLHVAEYVAPNTAPVVVKTLSDQAVTENAVFSYAIPAGTFKDADADDVLTYSVMLADGKPLPALLTFNPVSKTLSGTPDHYAVGDLSLSIAVKDKGGLIAKTALNLHVAEYVAPNTAPVAAKTLTDQTLTEKAAFSFALPAGSFTDVDAGDVLTYSATLADGKPLPAWLSFDAVSKTLSGTPDHAAVGDLSLSITVKDKGGLTASSKLVLHIADAAPGGLAGTDAADLLSGTTAADVMAGGAGADTLAGGAGSDSLTGGMGNDVLNGDAGDDQYYYAQGDGLDVIGDTAGLDTLHFGQGLSLDNLVASVATVGNKKIAQIRAITAEGDASQGVDFEVTVNAQGKVISPIDNFVLSGGKQVSWDDLLVKQVTVNGGNAAEVVRGGRNDDTIFGIDGNDTVYGGYGNDKLDGGNGEDVAYGGVGNDKLYGQSGNDALYGEDGDDLLDGSNGNDTLDGGAGKDTLDGGDGIDILYGRAGDDKLTGGNGNDMLDGGDGNDTLDGGDYDDSLYGGNGDDIISAGYGNDYVNGGSGVDTITLANGNDVVQGGAGNDLITGDYGNKLVDAGDGDDTITMNVGNHWYAGGKGNDTIDPGQGMNVFAFNRGDGADIYKNNKVNGNTISLGNGIKYADLSLSKSGMDLVLKLGQGDSITLKDWYANQGLRGVDRLQFITEGGDYDAASTDKTKNSKVEVFDFTKLVQKFDASLAATPGLNQWAVMTSMLDAHLYGSNTVAIGGDLSYQYGLNGNLAGIGLGVVQTSLAAGDFNNNKGQALHTRPQLETGALLLM